MATSGNDVFLDVAAPPSDFLKGLAARALELQEEIDGLEAIAAERRRDLMDITQRRMVDAMVECGFDELTTPSGHKFKLAAFVSGSLPKPKDEHDAEGIERRQLAIEWLTENGAANLIKSEVAVQFSKTEHNLAVDTQQSLIERGLPATLTSSVHAASLQAWAREAMREGHEVPFDKLGLNTGQYVKVNAPRGSKP